jgi:hypothetical protein
VFFEFGFAIRHTVESVAFFDLPEVGKLVEFFLCVDTRRLKGGIKTFGLEDFTYGESIGNAECADNITDCCIHEYLPPRPKRSLLEISLYPVSNTISSDAKRIPKFRDAAPEDLHQHPTDSHVLRE